MFRFEFRLSWPYKIRQKQKEYFEREWSVSKNKALSIQISKWGIGYTLIGIYFMLSHRTSHAGLNLEIELFNRSFYLNFFDKRHWDYESGEWEKYDES